MSPRKLALSTWIMAAMLAATTALAGSIDTVTVERDSTDPWQAARVRLFFTPIGGGAAQYLYLTLHIEDEAPLRKGEFESWVVRGQLYEGIGGGSDRVWVTVDTDVAYHKYPSQLSGNVYLHTGVTYADARFGHDGRVKIGAPPSIEQGKVDYTTPEAPVTLRFQDTTFEDNGAAPTSYQFGFYRRGFLGSAKLVAKGEFEHVDGEFQAVTVEKDGAFTGGAEEWFQVGSTYWVTLRIKRTGTEWYSDEFGPRFLGQFTYKEGGSQGFRLEALEALPGERGPTAREQVFQQLHAPASE